MSGTDLDLGRFAEPSLYILVSLSDGAKHGYAIMTDVEAISGSSMGPGTLYGALARLERRGLIEALEPVERRRPYRLTGLGEATVRAQLERLRGLGRDGPRAPAGDGVMTALLRLYPQAWRERYEVEFLDVLAARPPSLTDRLDILLGAVDAHLEPEVPGTERADRTSAPRDRIGAGLAITGGLLWVAAGILLVTASFGPEGFRDAAPAFIVSLFAGLAAAAAMVVIADGLPSHRVALRVLGLVSVVGVLLVLVPWPVIVVGLFGQWTASAIAGALLMGSGARVAGGALVAGSILAFGTNTENLQAALLVPYGLAWLVVGASLLAGNGWVTRAYPGQG